MPLDDERPESFLGLIAGFEGVSDGYTIIHGPTGCKYYPSSAVENAYRRIDSGLPMGRNVFRLGVKYFFGQPRAPCTYLDMNTFISGASDRLKDAYSKVEKLNPNLICLVNSPGASLVGEDLSAIKGNIPTVAVDHAKYSETCSDGFQQAVLSIIEKIVPDKKNVRSGVNLMGLSILHLNWQDTVEDLSELLELCGIGVNTCIGAGWSAEDVENSASAELNVLIYPEYGDEIAEFYEKNYGIPCFVSEEGAPVGFDSLEAWVKGICTRLEKDPSPALEKIMIERKRAAKVMLQMESCHLLPRARTYSLYCDGSVALSVSRFLYGYLGMIPVAIKCLNGRSWEEKTKKDFESWHVPVSDDPEHTPADIIICSGSIGTAALKRGVALGVAAVESPSLKFAHVDPEPPIGLKGTVALLDKVINTVANRQKFR